MHEFEVEGSVISCGRMAIICFVGCAWPTTDVIVGLGRCRPTAKRGRCLIRLYLYVVALCNFTFQIYIAAANLRKFENYFLRTVGNGGIEMVASQNFLKGAFFNFYKKGADAVY